MPERNLAAVRRTTDEQTMFPENPERFETTRVILLVVSFSAYFSGRSSRHPRKSHHPLVVVLCLHVSKSSGPSLHSPELRAHERTLLYARQRFSLRPLD